MLIAAIILLISLYTLVKSSDYLISSSSIIGSRAGISKVVIGLTLVAIGTSLPELMSVVFGLTTSTNGSDFFTGTIIGSNIANSLLIFATLLFFTKQKLTTIIPRENWFLTISTVLFIAMLLSSDITIYIGLMFILFFATYMYMTVFTAKKSDLEDETDEFRDEDLDKKSIPILIGVFILSLIFLNFAARGVVYGIDNVATALMIPQYLLTFTTVALATSLPELIVTIRSCKHGETDIAMGNIFGSNISNIFLIGGVGSVLIDTLNITITSSLLSITFLLISMLIIIFLSMYLKKKYYKKAAIIVFLTYIAIIIATLII